jgi:DNA modification methylase
MTPQENLDRLLRWRTGALINTVHACDAKDLLAQVPDKVIDFVAVDPMFGVGENPQPYDWGPDPARGDPNRYWAYHEPIYQELRRVLRPGGALAWSMGYRFDRYFRRWFGGHRIWSFTRKLHTGVHIFNHIWIVQTKEQQPIRPPDRDSLIVMDTSPNVLKLHPCPKLVAEMRFLVEELSLPGDIVLDCFCGLGATLIAAQQTGRRWLGCDLSPNYCKVAMSRLAGVTPHLQPPAIVWTSYQGDNGFLMAKVASLYLRRGDRIADVTYGKGVFWREIDLTQYDFHASDLLTVPERPYDFRSLPYRSEDFDVHVLDPPYVHDPSCRMDYRNYETTKGFSHDDIIQLYRDGMFEGHRILRPGGLMLLKCQDEIERGRQRVSHIEIHNIGVTELGMELQDLFILTQKHPLIRFHRPQHARKNHSYLWVFRKR